MSKRVKKETNNQHSNTKFGQARRRHSKRGVTSCLFAVAGILAIVAMFTMAYITYGEAHTVIGAISVLVLMLGISGVLSGLKGFRERDKNYLTCKIGIVINAVLVVLLLLLYFRGIW